MISHHKGSDIKDGEEKPTADKNPTDDGDEEPADDTTDDPTDDDEEEDYMKDPRKSGEDDDTDLGKELGSHSSTEEANKKNEDFYFEETTENEYIISFWPR